MARENRVRLSDEEKELLEEARQAMYPDAGEDVPLGKVIRRLSSEYLSGNGGGGDDDE